MSSEPRESPQQLTHDADVPQATEAQQQAQAQEHAEEALSAVHDGDLERALTLLARAVSLDPTNRIYQANHRRVVAKLDEKPVSATWPAATGTR